MAAAFVSKWSALNALGIHTIVSALRFFVAWFLKDWVLKRAAAQGKLFLVSGQNGFMQSVTYFCIRECLHTL